MPSPFSSDIPTSHPKFLSRSFKAPTSTHSPHQPLLPLHTHPITFPHTPSLHIQNPIMFSRTLLKQTRTALRASSTTSSLATRAQSQSPNILRESPFASSWSRQSMAMGRRWYSSEGEAKQEEGKQEESKEASAEDKQKLEIEKKDKEIIDLKVCLDLVQLGHLSRLFIRLRYWFVASVVWVRCMYGEMLICVSGTMHVLIHANMCSLTG